MCSLTELRPNKDLLDCNFQGYKLSLDSIPIRKHSLKCGIFQTSPSDAQYSLLHVKAFGYHNHLYGDPWSEDDVYFIDKNRKIQRNCEEDGVWEVPQQHMCKSGDYNMSLYFTSPDLAVITDGVGRLYLLSTGQRSNKPEWKVLFNEEICGKEKPFRIIHSLKVENADRSDECHCLLHYIDVQQSEDKTEFINVLHWIVLSQDEYQKWTIKSTRKLSSAGDFDYAAIEETGQSIYVASGKHFTFTEIDGNPVQVAEVEEEKKKPLYFWRQTSDDITVWLNVGSTDDIQVTAKPLHVSVASGGNVFLSGDTCHRLDSELTTWSRDSGKLEISLVKSEQGLIWREFLTNDSRGEELLDPTLVNEIHERLAHLCSDKEQTMCYSAFNNQQLEECDAPSESASIAVRMDITTRATSHKVTFGGSQWLFNVQLKPNASPALCIRHDVDGCVWQPEEPEGESPDWKWTHVGTFAALGYVQASKTQRKFSVCPPDMSYVAICETRSHIYIYRQPSAISSELRNRQTGKRVEHIAKQQVISLDTGSDILGVYASNQNLHVLTNDMLYTACICQCI